MRCPWHDKKDWLHPDVLTLTIRSFVSEQPFLEVYKSLVLHTWCYLKNSLLVSMLYYYVILSNVNSAFDSTE